MRSRDGGEELVYDDADVYIETTMFHRYDGLNFNDSKPLSEGLAR